jgi:glycosyltransferase 2 family protein
LTRFGSLLGLAIGLAGVAFVTRLVVRDWDEITEAVASARSGLLVVAVLAGLTGMAVIGVNWVHLVHRAGAQVRLSRGMAWYFVGQLGKYVPGGIWPVVGRAEMAVRSDVSRRIAYTTTAASMFSTYFTAGLVGAALLPWALGAPAVLAIGVPVLLAGAVAATFHPRVTGRLLAVSARLTKRQLLPGVPSWRNTLITLARHIPAWIAIALATWVVAHALGFDIDLMLLIAATPASWLAGFVVIGLPGGLGVRESVFVALVATQATETEALAVALLARMVFVAVDILGALLSVAIASADDRMRGRGEPVIPSAVDDEETPPSGSPTGDLAGSRGADL